MKRGIEQYSVSHTNGSEEAPVAGKQPDFGGTCCLHLQSQSKLQKDLVSL
jgi:hypothetical protein